MGPKHCVSRGHLVEIIKTHTKDQHELTLSFINGKDKMNYRSVQKLCDKKVTNLLSQTPGCEASATYLEMIQDIMNAFYDKKIPPLQRIGIVWEWIFFLRL